MLSASAVTGIVFLMERFETWKDADVLVNISTWNKDMCPLFCWCGSWQAFCLFSAKLLEIGIPWHPICVNNIKHLCQKSMLSNKHLASRNRTRRSTPPPAQLRVSMFQSCRRLIPLSEEWGLRPFLHKETHTEQSPLSVVSSSLSHRPLFQVKPYQSHTSYLNLLGNLDS